MSFFLQKLEDERNSGVNLVVPAVGVDCHFEGSR